MIRSKSETNPGDGVSVNQLVSAQPGLIPQMAGFLTNERIVGATVFVDHVTQYIYVHLMKGLTTDATIEAKVACEEVVVTRFVIFELRMDDSRTKNSSMMFMMQAINGFLHQNSIAERGIKELTLTARIILLHAQRHWPEYISSILWPLALKSASDRINHLSLNDSLESPLSRISGSANIILPEDFHTWGCPVYVLDHWLQSSNSGATKWEPRSRLEIYVIYVGRSPFHAGNVALVLNPTTGHVFLSFGLELNHLNGLILFVTLLNRLRMKRTVLLLHGVNQKMLQLQISPLVLTREFLMMVLTILVNEGVILNNCLMLVNEGALTPIQHILIQAHEGACLK